MKKMNRQPDGKVAGENLTGKAVPRKGGLHDATTGKSIGTRNVRKTGGRDTRKGS